MSVIAIRSAAFEMSAHIFASKTGREDVMPTFPTKCRAGECSRAAHWLVAASGAVALVVLQSPAANAAIDCLSVSEPLIRIPELVSQDGVLSGTVVLVDEQQRLIFRSPGGKPGQPGTSFECQPQRVRAFRGLEAIPPVPLSPDGNIDPVPGPTLRARVGDIIELTFLNHIDPNRFGASIDQGERRGTSGIAPNPASGCDSSNPGNPQQGYPLAGGDTFPDCFHGSSTGNIHFHGTHTNPNGTGDNVLLEIRPSPRDPQHDNRPTITRETVKAQFQAFFKACEDHLGGNALSEWPINWDQAPLGPWTTPGTWTADQAKLLQAYDAKTKEDLWGSNKKIIDQHLWPQYYIGAYPYCFRVPAYKEATWPPPPGGIRMGQSPGTHWYHAHKHGSTAINVANGMTGVFIIEGKYDDDLNAFYGAGWTRTQPVMVINQLGVSPNLLRSGPGQTDKGPDFSVNGRFQPVVDMAPGEVQLWRIANTSGRSGAYFAGFPPGFQWKQLAQDGVQFADANYQGSLNQPFLLAAGNRVDLLVKAPRAGIYPVLVKHDVDPSDLPSAFPVVLVQIRVRADLPSATGNRAQFIPTAPQQPAFLTNIADAEVASTINNPRVVTFKSTPPGSSYAQHTINGKKFEDGDVPIPVTLDAVEEWKIVNETFGPPIAHPFHIHLNPFQIVEVFDPNATVTNSKGRTVPKYVVSNPPPDPTTQCYLDPQDKSTWKDCHNDADPSKPRVWWDVFPIPSGRTEQGVQIAGYFKMRSRFVDFAGQYVLHCHILAHEDRGMMTIVQVTPANTQPRPTLYMHH
jgi:FtsP/CotA-like multicopper oxidase with cupredoxin domain